MAFPVNETQAPLPWQPFEGQYEFNVTIHTVDFLVKKSLVDKGREVEGVEDLEFEWTDMPPKDQFQSYCEATITKEVTFPCPIHINGNTILGVHRAIDGIRREYAQLIGKFENFCFYRNEKEPGMTPDNAVNPFNFHAFWKETAPEAEHWFRWCHHEAGFPNLFFYVLQARFENKIDEGMGYSILQALFPAYRYRYDEDIDHLIRD
jgi:hypothetical protein